MASRPRPDSKKAMLLLRRRIAGLEKRVGELEEKPAPPPAGQPSALAPPYIQPAPAKKDPAPVGAIPVPPPPQPWVDFTPPAAEARPPRSIAEDIPAPVLAVWRLIAPPRRPEVSLEVDLATRWLPRIGGLLLIIGAALAAPYIQPSITPLGRVAIGFAFAAALVGGGLLALRKNVIVGRTLAATGLALAFFVSFASHFIPETRVFATFLPAFLLMAGFAGTLMALADRWRSEAVGALGLLLGVVASLVSAGSGQMYTLVGLGVLAVAAGVLLVRREWLALTGMAVLCTYGGTVVLWFFFPPRAEAEAASNMAALLLYHLVFAASFYRWSARWLAREEQLAEGGGASVLQGGRDMVQLPFSSTYAIFNSLALIGLSVLLLYISRVWWHHLDTLFFALATMEAMRLLFPRLRHGILWNVHALTAASLVVAGTVTALDGPAEMVALTLQVLVLAVAAGRVPSLRFLMPLTVFPAGMALDGVAHVMGGRSGAPAAEIAAGLMLLFSVLPWGRFLGGGAAAPTPLLDYLERASAHLRTLCAMILLAVPINTLGADYMNTDGWYFPVFMVLAALLLAGGILLGARAWATAAMACTSAMFAMSFYLLKGEEWLVLTSSAVAVILTLRLWQEALRLRGLEGLAVFYYFTLLGSAFLLLIGTAYGTEGLVPWQGLSIFLPGVLIACSGVIRERLGIPILAKARAVYPNASPEWDWSWRWLVLPRPTYLAGFSIMGLGALVAIFADARLEPWSALLIGAGLLGAWQVIRVNRLSPFVFASGYLVMALGLTVYGEGAPWSSVMWLVLMLGLLPLTLEGKRVEAGLLQAVPPVVAFFLFAHFAENPAHFFNDWLTAIGCAVALLFAPLVYRLASRRGVGLEVAVGGAAPSVGPAISVAAGAATIVLLYLWTVGEYLPGRTVTVAWALTGMFVLLLGFLLREKSLRYISIAALVLTTMRVFFVDLAQADTLTKVIAFVVTGIVYIVAGMAYVFLRKLVAGPGEEK